MAPPPDFKRMQIGIETTPGTAPKPIYRLPTLVFAPLPWWKRAWLMLKWKAKKYWRVIAQLD